MKPSPTVAAPLHLSEDRTRLIIDTIPTMAWSLRPDAVLDFVNQRWLDYTGLSFDEAIEEPTRTVHPEDLPRAMEKWLRVKATSEAYEDEMRLQRADGEYRWFLVRIAPLRDEQGNLLKRYGVAIDIEERKQAEEKLKATSEQLRALSASVQSAREEEATRIAREIHDDLGAALTSLKLDLESVRREEFPATSDAELFQLREKIKNMMQLVDQTLDTVRRISSELRPSVLDDLGLVVAIGWQAQQFQNRTGIVVDCDCPRDDVDLNQAQSTAVFRIFQEALTNILRHAHATRVIIQMNEEDGQFILTINDNGRGVTADEKARSQSLGLLGMRERAHLIGGNINITGFDGKGTVVTVRIPISGQNECSKASRSSSRNH
jgi:PAS domain S-box-containing protein